MGSIRPMSRALFTQTIAAALLTQIVAAAPDGAAPDGAAPDGALDGAPPDADAGHADGGHADAAHDGGDASDAAVSLGSWATVASMPTARFDLAAAVGPDGRIYAIGGLNATLRYAKTVESPR